MNQTFSIQVLKRLKPRRGALLRLLLVLAVISLLRGIARKAQRPDIHGEEVPRLLRILELQRTDARIFLNPAIDETFIRKYAGITVVGDRPPLSLEELKQHLYVDIFIGRLGLGLDECDWNLERVLFSQPNKTAVPLVKNLASTTSPIAWARGRFVIRHLRTDKDKLALYLQNNLRQWEASPYGKYRSIVIAGLLIHLAPDTPGLLAHLKTGLLDHEHPGTRIMAADTLGRMGSHAWPAAPELIRAAFALDANAAAAARASLWNSRFLPVFPLLFMLWIESLLTSFGLAAVILLVAWVSTALLDASNEAGFVTNSVFAELVPGQRAARWVIFIALCCSVPTLGFYIIAAGLVPAIWYPTVVFASIISGNFEMFGFTVIFNAVHFAIYGGVLYVVALALGKLIYAFPSGVVRITLLSCILFVAAAASLSPIFLKISHGSSEQRRNIIDIWSYR